MEMLFSDRMSQGEGGVFHLIKAKKELLKKEGRKVFDMSIGTPDFLPADHIMQAMSDACKVPENYKYAITDLPELQQALSNYYGKRYGVALKAGEMTSVSGTQEGMAHIFFTLCNPDDIVLVPDPGYPIFNDGPRLAGAQLVTYLLTRDNQFLPDLGRIDKETVRAAKAMVVSYPLNPVGVTAPDSFYRELIAFA